MKRNTRKATEDAQVTTAKEVENPTAITPTPRNCWAVDTLIAEVVAIDDGVTWETDSPDANNARLDVTFSGCDERLADALSLLNGDSRVEYVVAGGEDMTGSVYVSFKDSPVLKDSRDPFDLTDAMEVLA